MHHALTRLFPNNFNQLTPISIIGVLIHWVGMTGSGIIENLIDGLVAHSDGYRRGFEQADVFHFNIATTIA